MKLSIVIPHRCAVEGLWATVMSLEMVLGEISHEYVVVCGRERDRVHDFLERMPNLKIWESQACGPAEAREFGSSKASGEWLLFIDDHVLVPDNFVDIFYPDEGDVRHCATGTYPWRPPMYEYAPDVEPDDMDAPIRTEASDCEPYPILSAGHGTFLVKKSAWDAMGGYGGIFDGWNGEEIYFGLKAWMHGFKVFMHPDIVVQHFVGKAPEWKNRDDAMKNRLARSKQHLLSLKTKYSYDEARELVKSQCLQSQSLGTR